jgi:lysophospholipase L1-like esterase
LFFHAFHDFRINESQFQLNWNEKFLHPYDNNNSYIHWCEAQGFKEITPGFFHFEPAGHRAWAEKVVNHIKQHNILQ